MSEKNTNQMKISNYVVGVGGNLRKTTIAIMKTEIMRYNQEVNPSKSNVVVFVTDNHHQELSKVHGTKIKGVPTPVEQDNPVSGVGYFDLREDNETIINNLKKYKSDDLIQDNPADSVDYQNALGDIEKFVKLHKMMNKKLLYTLPLVDSKSLSSINAIYELFAGKDVSNVLFEIVIFEGTMKKEDAFEEFSQAYASNPYVQALKETGQVREFTIDSVIEKEIGEAWVKKHRLPEIEKANDKDEIEFFDFITISDMYEEYTHQFSKWLPEIRVQNTTPIILKIVE